MGGGNVLIQVRTTCEHEGSRTQDAREKIVSQGEKMNLRIIALAVLSLRMSVESIIFLQWASELQNEGNGCKYN